jgi:hypothetical protein
MGQNLDGISNATTRKLMGLTKTLLLPPGGSRDFQGLAAG